MAPTRKPISPMRLAAPMEIAAISSMAGTVVPRLPATGHSSARGQVLWSPVLGGYGGQMRVVCVAGARPNFMKVKPVMDALEQRGAETVLVHTGQHYDPAMSEVFFEELGLRPPEHYLGVGSGTQAETTARVMTAFEPLIDRLQPDGHRRRG